MLVGRSKASRDASAVPLTCGHGLCLQGGRRPKGLPRGLPQNNAGCHRGGLGQVSALYPPGNPSPSQPSPDGPLAEALAGDIKGRLCGQECEFQKTGMDAGQLGFPDASLLTPGLGLLGKDSSELLWEPGRSGGPSLFGFTRALSKVNSVS